MAPFNETDDVAVLKRQEMGCFFFFVLLWDFHLTSSEQTTHKHEHTHAYNNNVIVRDVSLKHLISYFSPQENVANKAKFI